MNDDIAKRITLKANSEGRLITIPIDIAEEVSSNYSSEASSNKIEGGSIVTDHVRLNPIIHELRCFCGSRPPYNLETALEDSAKSFLISEITNKIRPLSGPESALALATAAQALDQSSNDRIMEVHNSIVSLWQSRRPIDVEGLFNMKSMVITGYSPRVTVKNGDGLVFNLTLQQVTILKSQSILIDVKKTNGDKKLAAKQAEKKNLGTQAISKASDGTAGKAQSILSKFQDKALDYVNSL